MDDLISKQTAIDAVKRLSLGETDATQPERKKGNEKCSNELPCGWCSLFDTPCFGREVNRMDDLISRQAAIDVADAVWSVTGDKNVAKVWDQIKDLPSARPEITDEQAILHLQTSGWMQTHDKEMFEMGLREKLADDSDSYDALLPSAQPERTCVNCGRAANNGGLYADGRTRCPIEEHYALLKDGYCHLWEKRNVTDDNYPERRTDED